MLALSFALPFLAATVYAGPALEQRQSLTPCELTFGLGGVDTFYNFTIGAVNKTLLNANNTGAPLVLGITQNAGAQQYTALSTYASYHYDDWSQFSLINGTLYPYDNTQFWESAVGLPVSSGQQVQFEISDDGLPTPTSPYCLIAGDDPAGHNPPYPILAVNGESDHFSLCVNNQQTEGPIVQNTVVWNASDSAVDQGLYDYSTCYAVYLQALPLSGQ